MTNKKGKMFKTDRGEQAISVKSQSVNISGFLASLAVLSSATVAYKQPQRIHKLMGTALFQSEFTKTGGVRYAPRTVVCQPLG